MSYTIARVWGIPIKVHITLILLLPLLIRDLDPAYGLALSVALFTCITLHELGHSFVAMRMGCPVSEILLLPIGGVAKMTKIPGRPRDEFLMAAAGPAVSFLLAALFFGLFYALQLKVPFSVVGKTVRVAILNLAALNLGWVIFNLVPAFPMDGGRILRSWLAPFIGRLRATRIASTIGKIISAAFVILGLYWHKWTLVFIGIVIFHAAGQEYKAVLAQERPRQFGGPFWFFGNMGNSTKTRTLDDVTVGPPPYEDR